MTNKIQCEAIVIHQSIQGMIRQKQICLHDVPNVLLGTSSHFFIIFLEKTLPHIDNFRKTLLCDS